MDRRQRDQEVHQLLEQFMNCNAVDEQFDALQELCLTKDGKIRSSKTIVTKFVKDRIPNAEDILMDCGHSILETRDRLNGLKLITYSRHLFHIAEAVIEQYAQLKRQRGVVDFDDLVNKSANLLNRQDISEWIRFRLDRGIDHVLVDEAQDTSPKQWEIVNAITADFHTGETASKCSHWTMSGEWV